MTSADRPPNSPGARAMTCPRIPHISPKRLRPKAKACLCNLYIAPKWPLTKATTCLRVLHVAPGRPLRCLCASTMPKKKKSCKTALSVYDLHHFVL